MENKVHDPLVFFVRYILPTFASRLDDKTSGLIWIQSVWYSDGIPDFFLEKADDKKAWKSSQGAKQSPHTLAKSDQHFSGSQLWWY